MQIKSWWKIHPVDSSADWKAKKIRRRNARGMGKKNFRRRRCYIREVSFNTLICSFAQKIRWLKRFSHLESRTTYTDPRLAFAVEDNDNVKSNKADSNKTRPRQRFDGSSKPKQILHGLDLSNRTFLITGANSGIGNNHFMRKPFLYTASFHVFRTKQVSKLQKAWPCTTLI